MQARRQLLLPGRLISMAGELSNNAVHLQRRCADIVMDRLRPVALNRLLQRVDHARYRNHLKFFHNG